MTLLTPCLQHPAPAGAATFVQICSASHAACPPLLASTDVHARFARLGILSCALQLGVTALPVSAFTQTLFCVGLDTSTQLHLYPNGAEPPMDRQTDRHMGLPACVPVGTAAPQGHAPVIFSHFIKLMCRRKLKEGSEHGSSNDARLAAVTSFSKNIFPLSETLYF